ncbi:hypothetical protein FF38_04662 [Lucilia cuprina]|uniref:Uncharacterized protein n=1 Tax=Lucilia cuprina TaxID=7375 RepID=A0A0L0BT76_LUCCU|nr:hypothetical protein FF38_04662 [Lucilia cuprina]
MDYILPNSTQEVPTETRTTLHEYAAKGDDNNLIKLLKSNKSWLWKEPKYGNTPLHEAAAKGYSRCLIILCDVIDHIQIKTKIDLKNNDGFSALHLAAQNGHNQCCRELLKRSASPNICNNYGDTPLHTACRYGHAGVLRILLSAFSNPNIQNNNGDTPLHIACAMGKRKLSKILLQAYSNLQIKNFQNETPFDIAKRKNHHDILHILQSSKLLHLKENVDKCKMNLFSNDLMFSPYGCHLLPETRSIFLTYVEHLPKLSLRTGEQYYFDLAGNLQKGPKCITNKCYCKPLIKHD